MSDATPIRILLADDHAIVREGLSALLALEPDMTVVAQADDGRRAVALAGELRPDVVVMDIGLPELNGIDATRQIAREQPRVKVLCLSMHSEKRIVMAVLEAGAAGYLVKSCASRELAEAIRNVAAGRTYLSPAIAGELVQELLRHRPGRGEGAYGELSEREREVLQLIAEGHSTKEIAAQLHRSEKTVAAHRVHILAKLHLQGVADLTRYAVREALIEP
jgi:DNA-binding NarL/FixJ family response regulator